MRILITCLVGTTLILCLVGKKFIFNEGNIKRTEAKEDNLNSRNKNAAAFNKNVIRFLDNFIENEETSSKYGILNYLNLLVSSKKVVLEEKTISGQVLTIYNQKITKLRNDYWIFLLAIQYAITNVVLKHT